MRTPPARRLDHHVDLFKHQSAGREDGEYAQRRPGADLTRQLLRQNRKRQEMNRKRDIEFERLKPDVDAVNRSRVQKKRWQGGYKKRRHEQRAGDKGSRHMIVVESRDRRRAGTRCIEKLYHDCAPDLRYPARIRRNAASPTGPNMNVASSSTACIKRGTPIVSDCRAIQAPMNRSKAR